MQIQRFAQVKFGCFFSQVSDPDISCILKPIFQRGKKIHLSGLPLNRAEALPLEIYPYFHQFSQDVHLSLTQLFPS